MRLMLQRHPSVMSSILAWGHILAWLFAFPYSASLSPLQVFLEKSSFTNIQIPILGFGSREPNPREPWYKSANLCQDSTPRSSSWLCLLVCMFFQMLPWFTSLLLVSFLLGLSFTCIHSLSEIKLSLWAVWYDQPFSILTDQLPYSNNWSQIILSIALRQLLAWAHCD